MKSIIFAEKEKTNAHRLTGKTYRCCNSKQICGKLGPTNHQLKLTSLPGDKNYKWTKKNCKKRGCGIFGKLKPVGQISKVSAFKQFQLVMTWLVIVAGLQCAGTNSRYHHYSKRAKSKTFRKHGFNGQTV